MKKIRIGNDIKVSWGITTNGEQVALEKDSLEVQLLVLNKTIEVYDFEVDKNVITFKFAAESQKYCGVYTIICRVRTENALNTIDKTKAFEIVPHTEEEDGRDNPNVALEVVTLSTDRDSSHIGKAATIRIGDVKSLPPGQEPYVKNSGTDSNAILDFGFPSTGGGSDISQSIVQTTGDATDKVMSQKAVTDQLRDVLGLISANSFALQMFSSNGWNFSHSMVTKKGEDGNFLPFTELSVKAFYYNKEVTGEIYKIKWTRETSYHDDDESWNLSHKNASLVIPIDYIDLGGDNYQIGDVIFKCEAQYTIGSTSYQSVRTINL